MDVFASRLNSGTSPFKSPDPKDLCCRLRAARAARTAMVLPMPLTSPGCPDRCCRAKKRVLTMSTPLTSDSVVLLPDCFGFAMFPGLPSVCKG